jgi:hypothetical protein
MEFRDEVALRFLDKVLDAEGVMASDDEQEDTIIDAEEIADTVAIYTNEFMKAHNATYHPDVLKKPGTHEPYKLPEA